jgi:hypothetical protein
MTNIFLGQNLSFFQQINSKILPNFYITKLKEKTWKGLRLPYFSYTSMHGLLIVKKIEYLTSLFSYHLMVLVLEKITKTKYLCELTF